MAIGPGKVRFEVNLLNNVVSLFPEGGNGWEEVMFFADSACTTRLYKVDGAGPFWVEGTVKTGTSLSSPDLDIVLRSLSGKITTTCEVDLSSVLTTVDDVSAERGESDVFSGSDYRLSILLKNDSSAPKTFELSIPTLPSGWHVAITDTSGNEIMDPTLPTLPKFTVRGGSEMIVYVKLINEGEDKGLPSAFDVIVEETVSGNQTTLSMTMNKATLELGSTGATGPNVFMSNGETPTIVFVLVVISILAIILIIWLGMKRGVFSRRK